MKLSRWLILIAAVLLIARPAAASSISLLVGDKDSFGTGGTPGINAVQWADIDYNLHDNRSATEAAATNGAQLTDIYSALWFTNDLNPCSPDPSPSCTPNKDHGTVIFPFSGVLQPGATLSVFMGGFQCGLWGAMKADINGVALDTAGPGSGFCFEQGPLGTQLWSTVLDPSAIAAANLIGEVRLNFDHSFNLVTCDLEQRHCTGLDYIAFDYFQLDGEVAPVPEPATFVLLGLGLAGLAARRRLRGRL